MYLTDFVRPFCKFSMICGIISSIIIGGVTFQYSVAIGIIIMCAGTLLSVLGIAFIMMICEMAESLQGLNYKMGKLVEANGETSLKSYNSSSGDVARTNKWKCIDCGNINPSDAISCRECGRPK